ncbi:MAG: hypothetical protein JW722_04185 [Demequinaceae bacterium]|nr:hypothetical protein [Demequinaceae bacterium]
MAESKKTSAPKAKTTASKETTVTVCCEDSSGDKAARAGGAGGGAVYGLGLIGAAVYYIQESTGFGEFLVACLKAIVWPAFVVYDLLQHMA